MRGPWSCVWTSVVFLCAARRNKLGKNWADSNFNSVNSNANSKQPGRRSIFFFLFSLFSGSRRPRTRFSTVTRDLSLTFFILFLCLTLAADSTSLNRNNSRKAMVIIFEFYLNFASKYPPKIVLCCIFVFSSCLELFSVASATAAES